MINSNNSIPYIVSYLNKGEINEQNKMSKILAIYSLSEHSDDYILDTFEKLLYNKSNNIIGRLAIAEAIFKMKSNKSELLINNYIINSGDEQIVNYFKKYKNKNLQN